MDNQETFDSGAVRDTRDGKGRYDLISAEALRRLALVLEHGAKHYSPNNWRKGMPLGRFFDSALRHLHQWKCGESDEDHLGHAIWNVMALIETEYRIQQGLLPVTLDDIFERCSDNYHQLETSPRLVEDPSVPPGKVIGFNSKRFAEQMKELADAVKYRPSQRIYVAGPYRAATFQEVTDNIQRADMAGRHCVARGHYAFVPHKMTAGWESTFDVERILELDFDFLRNWATAILYLAPSPGADRELKLAEELGLTVYRSLEEVPRVG